VLPVPKEFPPYEDVVKLVIKGSDDDLRDFLHLAPDLLCTPIAASEGSTDLIAIILDYGTIEKLDIAMSLGATSTMPPALLLNACLTNFRSHRFHFEKLLSLLFGEALPPLEDPDMCKTLIQGGLTPACDFPNQLSSLWKLGFDLPLVEARSNCSAILIAMDKHVGSAGIQHLIEQGARVDLNINDYILAASKRRFSASFLTLLPALQPDEFIKDGAGRTALHCACYLDSYDTAEILVRWKFPVDEQDNDGCTALHYAATNADKNTVELLLAAGADESICNALMKTPLDVATTNSVRKLLLTAGARKGAEMTTGHNSIRAIVEYGEPWTVALEHLLKDAEPTALEHWSTLLTLAVDNKSAKPSKTWSKNANAEISSIGETEYRTIVTKVLAEAREKRFDHFDPDDATGNYQWTGTEYFITENNTRILKSLSWTCARFNDAETCRTLRNLAKDMYKKVPGVGMRNAKIANAAMYALSVMEQDAGIKDIIALRAVTKYNSALTHINRLFNKLAEERNLSVEELEESATPDYGLTDTGEYHHRFDDDYAVTLQLSGVGKTELMWHKQQKTQKTLPAEVKLKYADQVKQIKALAKDLQQASRAHGQRMEQLYLRQTTLTLAQWTTQYLDHRLVGVLARRLIWRFTADQRSVDAMYFDGKLVDALGTEVVPPADSVVTLWHPIIATTEAIQQWRAWLLDKQLTQPFKQAHREIYVVTDAERTTSTYSLRYAGHALMHLQFNALATARGWQQTRGGSWDGGHENAASRSLGDLHVVFEATGTDEFGFTDSDMYRCVETDAVRFYRDNQPVALENLDSVVFSELMRDVDLFVGVSNIGNQPNPEEFRNQQRWTHQSFGSLNAAARTRSEVLEQLIGRLSVAEQLHIDGRFLHVQGKLRRYKIHLGSTNILMEPDDTYLCIVPARKQLNVRLPFEGDTLLSIIISKALLLASDDKIKDASIARQIRRRANSAAG
jgi:hypothetical protein